MSFRNIEIKSEYRSLVDNIVTDFYVPILQNSVLYKRAVGFFSSTALAEISKGILGLIGNGGRIELVASPYLSEEDRLAIRKGYQLRDHIIERALFSALTEPKDRFEEKRLNLLANLIAESKLEIKIAFTESKEMLGMYHEKMGLMYDTEGNVVAFSGSMNESSTAMLLNYESIDVYLSWTKDSDRVVAKERAFNAIWNNKELNVHIIDFPRVREEILRKYKKGSIDLTIDRDEFDIISASENIKIPGAGIPKGLKLHDYQVQAIDNWEQNNYHGIFDMATGTGKTLTGLGAIARLSSHVQHNLAVIIVCPYQHLVEQWVEDIVKFNINPIIGYSNSSQSNWKNKLDNAVRDYKLKVKNREFFCFVCTNATFATSFVQFQVGKLKGNALLVVDEAHNFGSAKLKSMLTDKFNYRLALSATLERHNDEEGTETLKNYFGNKCIEYSLEKAIEEKRLTPYKYYPIIVQLNESELQEYNFLSQEINKCIILDKNGKKKLSEKGERLALKRARLVAAAKSKIDKLKEVIQPYINDSFLLVYCGAASLLNENEDYTSVDEEEIRQIDAVTYMLGNELNMKVSQFTSKEDVEEREILKREFEQGENLQALIAIKCLDEGVNIPKIKVAFILSSTTNPKEYIQRRGRVLRLAKGKDYAEIYDFITTPRPLDDVSSLTVEEIKKDLSLIKNELNRVKEFARIAMNAMEADRVIYQIKDIYNLNDGNIDKS
ncbi:DEAD/DEAH box helicase family protein [Brevibacillus laterosporus]|uniref:DEAD/DEAH box helicase family protein n=1 Tax=Brevibacillus laterosporus TaxID=1465 RepID=UPI0018CC9371|nr:DEAD/DEAH box helicase family protein [Brevibacillus laterosporus]MBG9797117.1 DNA repair protein [Brevibacillus laterosporus]MCR8938058.1 DEAD/DEAH box helicase family protein [Brevibacillus laterosporus]MCZ0840698.1 DEAD/DEAH box helicase family protein [Brevibacillus laterosporus]MCZ0847495.1 DEAD/DEAH box helicase family protein [Brevibacillus laterosporus]MED1909218.1 DEAD/DEAH box helicase family protein [Brevibacillus laterosporus]